jgi:hypothetical protein
MNVEPAFVVDGEPPDHVERYEAAFDDPYMPAEFPPGFGSGPAKRGLI